MSKDIRIGLISGSLRKASFNTQLVQYVGKRAKEMGGVELVTIDLNQLDLPMFSEDLETDGLPQSALDLKELMISCDAFLISTPEYNGSISGMRHVRQILTQLQTFVIPQEYALGSAHQAFDENSDLKDEKAASFAASVGAETVRVCQKLK